MKKELVTRRRRFQRHARVVTESGGRGRVVGFYQHGEYLVLIDGAEIAMRYTTSELKPEEKNDKADSPE